MLAAVSAGAVVVGDVWGWVDRGRVGTHVVAGGVVRIVVEVDNLQTDGPRD